jgi:hypothetical protein
MPKIPRQLAELLSSGSKDYAESLRQFLLQKNVKKPRARWDLSDQALNSLVSTILVAAELHHEFPRPDPTVACFSEDAMRLTREAISALREVLPLARDQPVRVREYWEQRTDDHPFKAALLAHADNMIEQIDKVIANVASLEGFLGCPIQRLEALRSWRDHAVQLAQEFVRHYRECNSGRSIGLATDGPVAIFVAAVTPLITGERPTPNNVAGYLKGHRVEILGDIRER